MSVQVRGYTAIDGTRLIADVDRGNALRVVRGYGPGLGATGGRYRAVTISGALTAIAAVTASAGHLLGFRNPGTNALALVEKIKLKWTPTVLPSTAQEVGFAVYKCTACTASPTGGATVSNVTPQLKLRTSHSVPTCVIHYANGTAALTAGTQTLNTQPLGEVHDFHIIAGAAVVKNNVELALDFSTNPLVLALNEGFIVANAVLMANSLAGTLVCDIEWRECDTFGQ